MSGAAHQDLRRSALGPKAALLKMLFLHGCNLVPGGVKLYYLAQHCHEVVNRAFDDAFGGRIEQPETKNFIHGEAHVIQSVEDVHELQVVSRTWQKRSQ